MFFFLRNWPKFKVYILGGESTGSEPLPLESVIHSTSSSSSKHLKSSGNWTCFLSIFDERRRPNVGDTFGAESPIQKRNDIRELWPKLNKNRLSFFMFNMKWKNI